MLATVRLSRWGPGLAWFAGAAAIVYLLQFNMRYDTGFELGLIAFTAAVLGGIGNLAGALGNDSMS